MALLGKIAWEDNVRGTTLKRAVSTPDVRFEL